MSPPTASALAPLLPSQWTDAEFGMATIALAKHDEPKEGILSLLLPFSSFQEVASM